VWVPVGLQLADRPLTHSLIGPRTAERLVGLRLADRSKISTAAIFLHRARSLSHLLELDLGRPRADRYAFFLFRFPFLVTLVRFC